MWNDASEQIHRVAVDILGKRKSGRKFIDKQMWWWNEEVQQTIKEKKLAFRTWWSIHLVRDIEQCCSLKSSAKKAVTTADDQHFRDLYDQLDTPGGNTNILWSCC